MAKFLVFIACAALIAVALFASRRGAERTRAAEAEAAAPPGATREELVPSTTVEDGGASGGEASADARVPAESEASTRETVERRAPKTLIRGLVVDAATGLAVPDGLDLGVACRTGDGASSVRRAFAQRRVHVGAGGVFELETSHPDTLTGSLVLWATGSALFEGGPHRYADERTLEGTWRLPLDVGWLGQIELASADGLEFEVTRVRLLEVVDGEEQRWPEGRLFPAPLPVFVQHWTSFPADPSHGRWLEVEAVGRGGTGVARARVEVPVRNGVQPEPIRVEMPTPASASGRVVDESGAPVADASVQLLPLGPPPQGRADLVEETDDDGRFLIDEAWPGRFRARAAAPFAPGELRLVELEAGVNDLGTFVVPRRHDGGTIAGRVVGDGAGEDPFVLLTLRARASGAEIVGLAGLKFFGSNEGDSEFSFADVPPGEYELALESLDGRRYAPERLAVSPPATLLEFRAVGVPPVVFAVVAYAQDGTELDEASVVQRIAGRRLPFESSAREPLHGDVTGELVVYAPGHAAARIDASDFVRAADELQADLWPGQELRIAAVALERGFSLGVLVRDRDRPIFQDDDDLAAFGAGLADARILADGREVARSGADGFALVSLEHAPRAITCELPGWRALPARTERGAQVFWMTRE